MPGWRPARTTPTGVRHTPSELVILSPTLLTGETSDRVDDDHLVPDDRGSCKPPTRLPGICSSIAWFVNRFVNRTLRDSVRWGRRSRRSEMGSGLSAEVTTPARDSPRRQRLPSYGS
jgi:hypothetical protein